MTGTSKAYEFEALICEVQSLAIECSGMKADNKQREAVSESMAFVYDDFAAISKEMTAFAKKFRDLAKR